MAEPASPPVGNTELPKLRFLGIEFGKESLLLACVPVVSYFIAYAYENGYSSTYGIPPYLMDVNINTIFTVIVLVLVMYFCSHTLFHQYIIPVGRFLYPRITFFCTYWLGIVALIAWFRPLIGLIFLAGVILVCYFDVYQARKNKKEGDTRTLVERMRLRRGALNKGDFQQAQEEAKINKPILCIATVLVVYYTSNFLGVLSAWTQVNYNVLVNDEPLLLIYIKDGRAICCPFDPVTRHIKQRMIIVPLPDKGPTLVIPAGIGPLHFD